jgi:hypothetical protein
MASCSGTAGRCRGLARPGSAFLQDKPQHVSENEIIITLLLLLSYPIYTNPNVLLLIHILTPRPLVGTSSPEDGMLFQVDSLAWYPSSRF